LAPRSGAVYLFSKVQGEWQQDAYVKASNSAEGYSFGSSLAVSRDGNTLAVGADGESSAAVGINGNQNSADAPASGAVYMFVKERGRWNQSEYIKASNAEAGDGFGGSAFSITFGHIGN